MKNVVKVKTSSGKDLVFDKDLGLFQIDSGECVDEMKAGMVYSVETCVDIVSIPEDKRIKVVNLDCEDGYHVLESYLITGKLRVNLICTINETCIQYGEPLAYLKVEDIISTKYDISTI